MAKVHIALVGGQAMPVYQGIEYYKPDKVLFIYSPQTKNQRDVLKKQIIKKKIIQKEGVIDSEPLDAVDILEIEKQVQKYKEQFSRDEISINISSGTKAWSYLFSKEFESVPNATLIYIDQNNKIYDLKAKESYSVNFDFMMQFKLNKNPLETYYPFENYTKEDFELIEEIQRIRNQNIDVFTNLTNLDNQNMSRVQNQRNGFISFKASSVSWDKNNNQCTFVIKNQNEDYRKTLSSPNIFRIIFNYSWFELKVAQIISKWEKAQNIYMNCEFNENANENSGNQRRKTKNEIDIIVNAGNKALFVECKTNIKNITDIVKFSKAVENYGGKGSKSIFVSLNEFSHEAKEVIADCQNMLLFSFKENNNDDNKLIEYLDAGIKTINK